MCVAADIWAVEYAGGAFRYELVCRTNQQQQQLQTLLMSKLGKQGVISLELFIFMICFYFAQILTGTLENHQHMTSFSLTPLASLHFWVDFKVVLLIIKWRGTF